MPVRLLFFPDRPDALLVHLDEGEVVTLPPLTSPFDQGVLRKTCRDAGIDVRVIESIPGRWTTAIRQARQARHSEAQQRANLATETIAAQLRAAKLPILDTKADYLTRKAAVDTEIGEIRGKLSRARGQLAQYGVHLPRSEYQELQRRLDLLKRESQALQMRLGELRGARRQLAENHTKKSPSRTKRFLELVEELLGPEEFANLWETVDAEGEEAQES